MFAMKMFKVQYRPQFEKEQSVNIELSHPNLISFIEAFENQIFFDTIGRKRYVDCLVFEYAENGELYEYIASDKITVESCRKFFKQLIRVIHYLHVKGYCHRDLKPENILLDKHYNIKLCDLGHATELTGTGNGQLYDRSGTLYYMSPEIIEKRPYNGIYNDIF